MNKKSSQKIISKVASKKTLDQNKKALETYDYYRKTSDFIDRADVALGRKQAFKSNTGSTLNFEINRHGISSTTAQKI